MTDKSTILLGGATHKESEENMRKIIVLLMIIAIMTAMTVPAFAMTPTWEYNPVKLPTIKIDTSFAKNAVSSWFKANPIELPAININFTSAVLG